jgi:protein SCO1
LFVLTPAGRISRFFDGVEFSGRDLRLGLIEATEEKIGSLGDYVLLLCYHYDPARGTYGLAIMNGIRFAGLVTVLTMLLGFGWMMRRERQLHRAGLELVRTIESTLDTGKDPQRA